MTLSLENFLKSTEGRDDWTRLMLAILNGVPAYTEDIFYVIKKYKHKVKGVIDPIPGGHANVLWKFSPDVKD